MLTDSQKAHINRNYKFRSMRDMARSMNTTTFYVREYMQQNKLVRPVLKPGTIRKKAGPEPGEECFNYNDKSFFL